MSSSEITQPELPGRLFCNVNGDNVPFFDDAVSMAIKTIKKFEEGGAHGKATITIDHEYGTITLSI